MAVSPPDHSQTPWRPLADVAPYKLRRRLYQIRNGLRPIQRPRIRACGYALAGCERVSVIVGESGRARFSGLAHCGSVWECPTCRAAIQASRAEEVRTVVQKHGAARAVMVTLTLRHGAGDDLQKLRKGLADAYRGLCRGKPWDRFKARVGLRGSIRALELTHGWRHGWHPHLHIVWLLDDEPDAAELLELEGRTEWLFQERGWFVERWAEMVERYIGPECRPDLTHGISVVPVERVDYLAKLGLEIADPGSKQGRKGGRTPLQIAADYVAERRQSDARLWRHYVDAIRGARQLTWSLGLRSAFGLVERSDLELAEEEQPTRDDRVVATIPAELWKRIRNRTADLVRLLEAVETAGTQAFGAILENLARGP